MRAPIALAVVLIEYLLVSVGLDSTGTPWGYAAAFAVAAACAVVLFAERTREAIFALRIERRAIALHAALAVIVGVVIVFVRDSRIVAALAVVAALPIVLPIAVVAFLDRRAVVLASIVGVGAAFVALRFGALWPLLADATLRGVAFVLRATGVAVIEHADEAIVGTTSFVVRIDPTCSGMEGLGLMLVFVGAGLFAMRRQLVFPRAWILLPAAAALVLVLNVLRISALIGVGHAGAPELALGGFHSRAGWVGFCAVAAIVVEVARRSRWLRRTRDRGAFDAPAVAYLAPVAALLAGKLVVPPVSADGELAYVVSAIACAATLVLVRGAALREFVRSTPGIEAVAVGVAVYLVWRAFGSSAPAEPFTATTWSVHFAVSVFLIPVVEELAFRGYLMRRLFARHFEGAAAAAAPVWAVIVSAFVFGAAHERFVAAVFAGLAFAFVYRRRGRLLDAVVAHAVANALIALEILL